MSLLIALLFSLPLGVLSAIRRNRAGGTAINVGSQALAAVPVGAIVLAVLATRLAVMRALSRLV